jgi:hypothetical protein
MTEDEFQAQVIKFAKFHGWRVAHFRPLMDSKNRWRTAVQGDGVGFPDLILVKPGLLIVAELKVGKRKPTSAQYEWLEDFERAGIPAYTWRPSDWSEIEAVLSGTEVPATFLAL